MQDPPAHAEVVASFEVASRDVERAVEAIAIGQSIGNPNLRSSHETVEMWERFGCRVLEIEPLPDAPEAPDGVGRARTRIAFPAENFTPGSLTHLLTCVMGGQVDIDLIEGCRLVDLELPDEMRAEYIGPRSGIEGMRALARCHGRPLVGGIVKPKTGITVDQLVDICKQMADGGVDFIKEDEILGDIPYCPLPERVERVVKALEPYPVIYAPCVTAPVARLEPTLHVVRQKGANAYHFNVWGGLDLFRHLAEGTPLVSFYQKSGDRVMTTGRYSVDFRVWCRLARLAGADAIHAGMLGGYLDEGLEVMRARCAALRDPWGPLRGTLPSLSCGATPGMVPRIADALGNDVMIASGGAIHAHPGGTGAGARAFRDAAEGRSSPELDAAIEAWGR